MNILLLKTICLSAFLRDHCKNKKGILSFDALIERGSFSLWFLKFLFISDSFLQVKVSLEPHELNIFHDSDDVSNEKQFSHPKATPFFLGHFMFYLFFIISLYFLFGE